MLNYIFINNKNPHNPIIFIHGFTGHASDHFEFQSRIKTHDYYAVILPGHNGKVEDQNEMNLQNYKNEIIRFFYDFDLDNAILIGHSMGAAIATLVAKELGTRIQKLVLISPITPIIRKTKFLLNFYSIHIKTQKALHKIFPKVKLFVDKSILWTEDGRLKFISIAKKYRPYVLNIEKEKIKKNFDILFKDMTSKHNLKLIDYHLKSLSNQLKVYLIQGKKDWFILPSYTKKYLKNIVPNIEIFIMAKTGHVPYLDNYSEYENIMNKILS